MRAGIYTLSAADALTAVGGNARIDIHLAGFSARFAANALACIKMQTVKGDLIEEAVDRAQRADVFAERSVNDETYRKYQSQDYEFEAEYAAELTGYLLVKRSEPDASDRSGRADIFAEERCQLEAEWQHQHKENEYDVLEPAQIFVDLKFVFLEEGDPVEKVLQKAKRTKESADRAADQGADKDKDSDYIVGDLEL